MAHTLCSLLFPLSFYCVLCTVCVFLFALFTLTLSFSFSLHSVYSPSFLANGATGSLSRMASEFLMATAITSQSSCSFHCILHLITSRQTAVVDCRASTLVDSNLPHLYRQVRVCMVSLSSLEFGGPFCPLLGCTGCSLCVCVCVCLCVCAERCALCVVVPYIHSQERGPNCSTLLSLSSPHTGISLARGVLFYPSRTFIHVLTRLAYSTVRLSSAFVGSGGLSVRFACSFIHSFIHTDRGEDVKISDRNCFEFQCDRWASGIAPRPVVGCLNVP